MRLLKIFLGAGLIAGVILACNKNVQRESDALHSLRAGTLGVCDCNNIITSDVTLSGNITSNTTLYSNVRYKLQGLVFVTNGAILTIEKGTRIEGIKPLPGGTVAGLVITRGARIDAQGTSSCPIVFTSDQASPASGDWGGLVILGNAQTNNAPAFVEGIDPSVYPNTDYGSATTALNGESSGILRCVRIEYAGFELAPDNEMNGLTLAGVGSGTTIDYVEVFKANDDAFEFFGGTVNASHLLAIDPLDDMFDADKGYTGNISYALGLADPARRDKSQSNGIECDNDPATTTAPVPPIVPATPVTHPHFSNVTIVGVDNTNAHSQTPSGSYTLRYGRAAHMRRNARFDISNSIVFGYCYGISLDKDFSTTTQNTVVDYNAGLSTLNHVYSAGYGNTVPSGVGPWAIETNGTAATGNNFCCSFAPTAGGGNVGSSSISNNPFNLASPYGRPCQGCSVLPYYVPTIGQAARPYGAFPVGVDWTNPDGCSTSLWSRYN